LTPKNLKNTPKAVRWTSGALFDDAELGRQRAAEAARLAALRDDADLPLVWLDVSVKGSPVGRLTAALFVKDAPRAAENFRQLCTGESAKPSTHGRPAADGGEQPYTLKGKNFYRIIHEVWVLCAVLLCCVLCAVCCDVLRACAPPPTPKHTTDH
jgi:peptidyl-prolyl isomerase D